jgi:uncharacterized membrane protein
MVEYQKVWVVNVLSGPQTENKLGSDCTLTDGDVNRVLTLANTSTSANELVVVDGFVLRLTADYTVSHLAASTTITFLGKIWDAQKIDVRYYI